MKSEVTSAKSGKVFDVAIDLRNGNHGENYSMVIVDGEPRHTYWFLQNDGTLLCRASWNDGVSVMEGVLTQSCVLMQNWITTHIARRKKDADMRQEMVENQMEYKKS